MPPMPPMATTTKSAESADSAAARLLRSRVLPATESAESAEKQAAPKQAETTSSVGGAPVGPQVSQAASADSDLPELKALGQRWGLW